MRESFDKLITVFQNGKVLRKDVKTVIFILHAGSKKSHKGGEVPREEIASLVKKRKSAEEYYSLHRIELRARFQARRLNRARQPKDVC